jgi:Tol biopolymer transport system component
MVSVSSAGDEGNDHSVIGAISADARFVAFSSWASNLVPGDTNGKVDVFIHDRLLRTTERASVSSNGTQGNDHSGTTGEVCISGDGRFVAFTSWATNLVAGDTNEKADIFVWDRLLRTTERVSVSSDGQQANGDSAAPSVNADGAFVAFQSDATNLVPDDTNGYTDVFVRNRLAQTTARISVTTSGEQGNGASYLPSISADGTAVAFTSYAVNLLGGQTYQPSWIFVRDREASTTNGIPLPEGQSCWYPVAKISGDGRFVVLTCGWLLSCCTDCTCYNSGVWLHDRQTGSTAFVGQCYYGKWFGSPVISADGRYVWFTSMYCYEGSAAPPRAARNPSGPAVIAPVYPSTQWVRYTFVYDRLTGRTETPLADVLQYDISADGRFVAFSTNDYLVGSGYAEHLQVLVWDRFPDAVPPETEIVSGPCGQVACPSVGVSWKGTDDRAGPVAFAWRLDAGTWSAWTTDTTVTLTGLSDGAHVFEVKARDLSGNEDPTPARCEFTVAYTPSVVSITSPADGATVRGTVTITAAVSGVSSVERVEFYVNGQLLCTDTEAPYTCGWDATDQGNGPAEICVRAFDKCARSAQQCITVTVRNQTFEDVPPDHPAWLAIETIAARGITSGCLPAQQPGRLPLFCPYANVTRAQLAAFICRAAGKQPLNRDVPTFADVPKTHWAYAYIERFCDAASWGGSAPGTWCAIFPQRKFCPGASVTREQIAWILGTAAGKPPMPSCSGIFADVPASNPFCRWIERLADATSWPGAVAVTSGCICPSTSLPSASLRAGGASPPGYPPAAKCYCPKSPVTRAQMAVFLVRAFAIPL